MSFEDVKAKVDAGVDTIKEASLQETVQSWHKVDIAGVQQAVGGLMERINAIANDHVANLIGQAGTSQAKVEKGRQTISDALEGAYSPPADNLRAITNGLESDVCEQHTIAQTIYDELGRVGVALAAVEETLDSIANVRNFGTLVAETCVNMTLGAVESAADDFKRSL